MAIETGPLERKRRLPGSLPVIGIDRAAQITERGVMAAFRTLPTGSHKS